MPARLEMRLSWAGGLGQPAHAHPPKQLACGQVTRLSMAEFTSCSDDGSLDADLEGLYLNAIDFMDYDSSG